jgi:SAM-dependent methyltransferase
VSTNPYRVFAAVYDQDVQLEVPRAFFRTLRPLIRAHVTAEPAPPVLDLGCGSGLLTELLAGADARVLALDASRAMLARARKRCAGHGRRVRFVHARLQSLRVAEPATLALACQDVFNHLPTRAVLERAFTRVARALAPGGVLVFDTVTRYCFETYWTDNTHLLEGPLGDVLMSCDWDAARARGSVRIIGYRRTGPGRYARAETVLHEYLHDDAVLARALRRGGFARVWSRPWSPWRVQDAEAKRHRRLWAAETPGATRASAERLRALGFRPVAARRA